MREFLRGLELDEETVDTIMAEVGKGYTKLKEEIEELKETNFQYVDQIRELNGTIESNNKSLENLQTITKENSDLKAQLQMSNSGVKKEFSKFVTSEIMSQVDDDNDFETVLGSYKKDNPQYFGGETVVKTVQSSPSLSTGGNQPQTTSDIMNNILRSGRNE